MLILAIETAVLAVGIALAEDDVVLDEALEARAAAASESLLFTVEAALASAGRVAADIGGIAVTHGPGSFTGVRVGLAAAQGLALGWDVPLVSLSTLDVLLWPHLAGETLVVGALDARRQQVYVAAARALPATAADDVAHVLAPQVAAPEDIAAEIAALAAGRPVLFVGTGARLLAPHCVAAGVGEAHFGDPAFDVPRPATLARLGGARLRAGGAHPPEHADAQYLRGADARTLAERAAARGGG